MLTYLYNWKKPTGSVKPVSFIRCICTLY